MVNKKPMSKEERLKVKRECERRRRERLKQDEEKLKALKIKKHEIYLRAKEAGKVKCVADMNDREIRQKRKQWKKNTQKRRERLKSTANNVKDDIPIASTSGVIRGIQNEISPQRLNTDGIKKESSQKKRGRKVVKKDRAAAYRKIKKLAAENIALRRSYEKYKKRYQRILLQRTSKNVELTPSSKVKKILKQSQVKDPNIRKRLLFAEVLENELKGTFQSLKTQKEKQIFTKVIGGKLITKYKLQKEAKGFLSTKLILSNSKRLNRFSYERLPRKSKQRIRAVIDEFWNTGEFTTVCPGKKDVVKKNGLKKQKHYLNDTLINLHLQFLKHQTMYISYSLFCKLKPFWVFKPNIGFRDTCLCIKHENFRLFTEKLQCLGLIPYKNPNDTLKVLTCTNRSEACLNRSCDKCVNNTVPYSEFDFDKATEVKKWVHKKEERISSKTKKKIMVQMTYKESILCSQGQVVKEYENMQVSMLLHTLNITHQFKTIQILKKNLTESDLFIHVDFSENYQCKYAAEPQSVHFGASRQQITLHTGMTYTKNFKEGFSTVSPSLNHQAQAHTRPILEHYLNKFPNVTNIHFLSDSPNNQYRNKKMFLIMSKRFPELYPCLQTVTWHYSEAGHGKGAPDGIGGTLKRTADRVVAEGHDISNFDTMFNVLYEKTESVFLKKVDENDIQEEERWLKAQDEPKAVKGCMKVHQVTWSKSANKLMFRNLSCLDCKASDVCKEYHIAEMTCWQPNVNPQNQFYLNKSNIRNIAIGNTDISIGQWVVIRYDNTLYPGEVCSFNENGVEVNVMHPAGVQMQHEGKQYKWPTVVDKHVYQHKDIMKVIDPPKPTSSRAAFFTFDNL